MNTGFIEAPTGSIKTEGFSWEEVPVGAKFYLRDNKTPYFKLSETHFSYRYRYNEAAKYTGFVNDIVWHSQMWRTA